MKVWVFVFGLLASSAVAETSFLTTQYVCDRDVLVPASYIDAVDRSYAVIYVEGRQITLTNQPAASGARFGSAVDGASYVWWTKGDEATLFWKADGEETALLSCKEQG